MNALALHVASLATAQFDAAKDLVQLLKDGGPWALLALALIALVWLAKAYVGARDERDKAVSDLNTQLTGLIKEMVAALEQWKATGEKQIDALERIERRLENVPQQKG
jgi:hypothetical protein